MSNTITLCVEARIHDEDPHACSEECRFFEEHSEHEATCSVFDCHPGHRVAVMNGEIVDESLWARCLDCWKSEES